MPLPYCYSWFDVMPMLRRAATTPCRRYAAMFRAFPRLIRHCRCLLYAASLRHAAAMPLLLCQLPLIVMLSCLSAAAFAAADDCCRRDTYFATMMMRAMFHTPP